MKKIQLSLAALTLVLAIAGTTTVNATRSHEDVGPCWQVDPGGTDCLDQTDEDCCFNEDLQQIIHTRLPRPR